MVQHSMSWGRSLYLHSSPVPGHELVDTRFRPEIDESGQQVGEVDLRIDLVQLARLCRPPNYAERARFSRNDRDLDVIGSA